MSCIILSTILGCYLLHAIYRVEPFNRARYSLSTHNWPSHESTKGQYQVENIYCLDSVILENENNVSLRQM